MSTWKPIKLTVGVSNVKLQSSDQYELKDLEVAVKQTSGDEEVLAVGDDANKAEFDLTSEFGVIRFTLMTQENVSREDINPNPSPNKKRDGQFIGSVSFQNVIFRSHIGKNYKHWVSLSNTPSKDEFTDE
jgi:hypothetical protein